VGFYPPETDSQQVFLMETRNITDLYEVTQTRDSIPSTLLAKGRGDTAAAELKKGLRLQWDSNAIPKILNGRQ